MQSPPEPVDFNDDDLLLGYMTGRKQITNDRCMLALRELDIHDKKIRRDYPAEEYLTGLSEYGLVKRLERSYHVKLRTIQARENYIMPLVNMKYIGVQMSKKTKTKRLYYITKLGKEVYARHVLPLLLKKYDSQQDTII